MHIVILLLVFLFMQLNIIWLVVLLIQLLEYGIYIIIQFYILLYGHEGPIYLVSFNKNGEFICSGGIDADLLLWKNNLGGKLVSNDNKIMGGLAYPDSKKIPKSNKSKKKYLLRSKSSNKFSVK